MLAFLAGVQASTLSECPQSTSDKEAKSERRETKPGTPGYGATKRFPYIDE